MRVEIKHKPAYRALAGRPRYALGAARLGSRRRGFTLIEMMIALSVFLLLMVVVFVPLTQAVSTFNAGRADIELQQTAQQTMNQIEAELQKAVYVFPNDELPGVSSVKPYYLDTRCTGARVSNPGRLDFITGDIAPATVFTPVPGATPTPLPGPTPSAPTPTPIPVIAQRMSIPPATFVTTFYPRRIDTALEYAPYDNEFTLMRAQIPYQYADGSNYPASSSSKVDTSAGRNAGACGSGSEWLVQGRITAPIKTPATEPDLEGPSADAALPTNVDPNGYATTHGSNNIMLPREISNATTLDNSIPPVPQPETTFICEDTNGDGKIDRVTVNLALQQFETATSGGTNGGPRRHVVRLSQTIDLRNIR